MRAKQEEKLFKHLNKFYKILSVFGAAPLPQPFAVRVPYAAAHIIWNAVAFTAIAFASIQVNGRFHSTMPPIQRGLYTSEYITNTLNVGLINFGIYYYRKYFHQLFKTLLHIDRKLWSIRVMHSEHNKHSSDPLGIE